LARLASEPSRVFTKEQLLREVWGFRALGRTRTLESHASRLRRKLTLSDEDRFIVNVWGVATAVAGGVPKWREVAFLRCFRASLRLAEPSRFRTFGDFLGTQAISPGPRP